MEYEQKVGTKKKLELQLHLLTEYQKAMGKNGIPFKLLNQTLPKIETIMNNILEKFVNFRVSIRTTDKSIDLFRVTEKEQWSASLCSGSERFTINLAFRIAIQNFLNISKPNFLIIDEGFDCFDEKHITKMKNIFDIIHHYFDYTIIITHINALKSEVGSYIDIQKMDGRSMIV